MARSDAGGAAPPRYPELQAHHDAVYDRLAAGRTGRAAGPLLDVGSGDGAALAATVAGTGIGGVALDRRLVGEWRGPAGFARIAGEASRLPFAAGTFPSVLMQETWEWLSRPAAVAGELARVSRGRVVVVQSDWRTLWLDSGDPETAREFTRLFAGPADPRAAAPAALLAAAGMRVVEDAADTIRGERLRPGTYALELLRLLRAFLVVQSAGVRARRFDDWRAELEERAARGAFAFSIERRVVVAEAG